MATRLSPTWPRSAATPTTPAARSPFRRVPLVAPASPTLHAAAAAAAVPPAGWASACRPGVSPAQGGGVRHAPSPIPSGSPTTPHTPGTGAPSPNRQPFGQHDAGAARTQPLPATPWHAKELRWLAAFLPQPQRNDLVFGLGETLHWRARACEPLAPPEKALERTRFGLLGEQLCDLDFEDLRQRLRAELREAIRTLEGEQPRLVRNLWLAMHSVRLGQIYRELLRQHFDALEEARSGLNPLWV